MSVLGVLHEMQNCSDMTLRFQCKVVKLQVEKISVWLFETLKHTTISFPLLGLSECMFLKDSVSKSPLVAGRIDQRPLAAWPERLSMRKRPEQKDHLSLLLGDKSTFVFLAKLKECHYYQINCVVTNQSSHLSFKCESL